MTELSLGGLEVGHYREPNFHLQADMSWQFNVTLWLVCDSYTGKDETFTRHAKKERMWENIFNSRNRKRPQAGSGHSVSADSSDVW